MGDIDETELLELENEIAGDDETRELLKDDFEFKISVRLLDVFLKILINLSRMRIS